MVEEEGNNELRAPPAVAAGHLCSGAEIFHVPGNSWSAGWACLTAAAGFLCVRRQRLGAGRLGGPRGKALPTREAAAVARRLSAQPRPRSKRCGTRPERATGSAGGRTYCARLPRASVPMPGFGASDCGCPSHLFFFKMPPSRPHFAENLRRPGDPPAAVGSGRANRSMSAAA